MLLGKRIIPTFFHSRNTRLFEQWQYNACRQTAFVVAQYLSEIPEFANRDIILYEGEFADEAFGIYDHAYVYVSPYGDESGLLVDVARVSYPCFVRWVDEMPEDMGVLLSEVAGWKVRELTRNEFYWPSLLDEKEYYTGLPYQGVAVRIINQLKEVTTKH